MPWYVLLTIALASLALVIAMLVWLGRIGWRLAKHGAAVSQRITPLADGLARRSDEIAAAAERLSVDAEQLTANLARMQRSAARLQVVTQTVNDALRPYWLIAGWLSGEKEWSDLGI
ncbi:MAG: hypothetical protein ACM3MJ_08220 [Deltaproteobacteria bacterium]